MCSRWPSAAARPSTRTRTDLESPCNCLPGLGLAWLGLAGPGEVYTSMHARRAAAPLPPTYLPAAVPALFLTHSSCLPPFPLPLHLPVQSDGGGQEAFGGLDAGQRAKPAVGMHPPHRGRRAAKVRRCGCCKCMHAALAVGLATVHGLAMRRV